MAPWAPLLALLAPLATPIAGADATHSQGAAEAICHGPSTPAEFFDLVANPKFYDKTARPPCENSTHKGPTVVEVQLRLTQLNSVDPKVGTIVVNGYLRTWWRDPRLSYNGTAAGGCVDAISISGDGIWTPDIYVDNLVKQTVSGLASLTQVYPDGGVWASKQALLTVKSEFDLTKLPYDSHIAEIRVASYSQDIRQMRVMAMGGAVGPGVSGVGVSAASMKHSVWQFAEGAAAVGFETPGEVEVSGGWDYLTMSWRYSRQPKYFINQVILPSFLFLLISYMQFWVSAAAVPARAALAVIPVLIMRTMSNSIYTSIPQGSQFMWLDSFVQISMFLCVAAALHFGVVQALRVAEGKRAAKRAGLVQSKPIVDKLAKVATRQQVPLLTLLRKFAPVQKNGSRASLKKVLEESAAEAAAEAVELGAGPIEGDDGVYLASYPGKLSAEAIELGAGPIEGDDGVYWASYPGAGPIEGDDEVLENVDESTVFTVQSQEAQKEGVTEADLLFIMYTRSVFQRYDADGANKICTKEVRSLLTFFGVYMSPGQVEKVMAMFLRDSGHPSYLAEGKNVLTFSQFVKLLMVIDMYSLKLRDKAGIVAFFQSIPHSERWDVGARLVFPLLMTLQFSVLYSVLASI